MTQRADAETRCKVYRFGGCAAIYFERANKTVYLPGWMADSLATTLAECATDLHRKEDHESEFKQQELACWHAAIGTKTGKVIFCHHDRDQVVAYAKQIVTGPVEVRTVPREYRQGDKL